MRWLPVFFMLCGCSGGYLAIVAEDDDSSTTDRVEDNDTDPVDDDTSDDDSSTEDDTQPPVDVDGDGYNADTDCDDTDPDVNPNGYEVFYDVTVPGSGILNCKDGVDNDCDGAVDAADVQCADQDLDGIPDGVDYLFVCDTDWDGHNEAACMRADKLWAFPWNAVDCISQVNDFTNLAWHNAYGLVSLTWGGESFEACPVYPQVLGNQDARAVSSLGADGVSTVDPAACADWQPVDLSTYCTDWPDNLCTTVDDSDGCEAVGKAISFIFDGITVTP